MKPPLSLALHDPHPDVREGAVRLAGRLPGLSGDLLALADDREIRVRFQVALALGDLDDGRAPGALARIAARDVGDPWVRLAVLSGLRETAWPFLQALLAANPGWLDAPTPDQARLLAQTAAILGAAQRAEELRGLADRLVPDGPEGLGRRGADRAPRRPLRRPGPRRQAVARPAGEPPGRVARRGQGRSRASWSVPARSPSPSGPPPRAGAGPGRARPLPSRLWPRS